MSEVVADCRYRYLRQNDQDPQCTKQGYWKCGTRCPYAPQVPGRHCKGFEQGVD